MKTPKPIIKIKTNSRYIEATADAPDGYSWPTGAHQLVDSWIRSDSNDRADIRERIEARVQQAGQLRRCSDDCECQD